MPSDKLLSHPAALCNIIRRTAVKAGHATLDYFEQAGFGGADEKVDGSPVTAADLAAEKIIEKELRDLLPDIPFVAEEAVAAGHNPELSDHEYFWLVDPLDGTREFISGSGDYTVNIALIKKDTPLLGVVYAPVRGELYAGHEPGSAIKWIEDTDKEKSISVRRQPAEGLTVVASRNHSNSEKLETFLKPFKVNKLIKRGSSLKICAIAEGKADLYPRLGPTCEWDTAAGDAVLRAAGGSLALLDGELFSYGHRHRKYLNTEFIAAGTPLIDQYRALREDIPAAEHSV